MEDRKFQMAVCGFACFPRRICHARRSAILEEMIGRGIRVSGKELVCRRKKISASYGYFTTEYL